MTENWINENFCSLSDDKVRVEYAPQIVELPCTDENLDDSVTMPYYKTGKVDALGKVINPKTEDTMNVVDWKGRHSKFLWKVYHQQEMEAIDISGRPMLKFVKVAEFEDKAEALKLAKSLESNWTHMKKKIGNLFGGE